MGVHGRQFPFRIAECRQLPAEDAAGIDAPCMVLHTHFGSWRMPINDQGVSPVIVRPVQTDRQSEPIRLTVRISVEAEIPDARRCPPDILLPDSGVCNYKFSVIQPVIAHKRGKELPDIGSEGISFPFQFFDCRFRSMGNRNISAA